MGTVIIVLLLILAAVVVVAALYVLYIFLDYKRIPDGQELKVNGEDVSAVPVVKPLSILTYNIGFAAYEQDYSFFMDDGKYSRAYSKKNVLSNMEKICKVLGDAPKVTAEGAPESASPYDFMFIQEVDFDSTRSYHVDEAKIIREKPGGANEKSPYADTFAVNYDSPYLFYPFIKPHGKSRSGIMTLSKYGIRKAVRRSLPLQTGFAKFIDLDRCYSVNRIPVENGKELVLIDLHLSAYTTDKTLSDRQVKMLLDDMLSEYQKGNYTVAGGDFNKDLLGDSGKKFVSDGHKHSGVTSFPFSLMPKGLRLIVPYDEKNPVATCRNAHEPYKKDSTYIQTIDGFIVSDNIQNTNIQIIDTEFMYSDHNPVSMGFRLEK